MNYLLFCFDGKVYNLEFRRKNNYNIPKTDFASLQNYCNMNTSNDLYLGLLIIVFIFYPYSF